VLVFLVCSHNFSPRNIPGANESEKAQQTPPRTYDFSKEETRKSLEYQKKEKGRTKRPPPFSFAPMTANETKLEIRNADTPFEFRGYGFGMKTKLGNCYVYDKLWEERRQKERKNHQKKPGPRPLGSTREHQENIGEIDNFEEFLAAFDSEGRPLWVRRSTRAGPWWGEDTVDGDDDTEANPHLYSTGAAYNKPEVKRGVPGFSNGFGFVSL
jgi:hypothetical protein